MAEKYGLKVWLCRECHNKVHNPRTEADRMAFEYLQKVGQKAFEEQIGDRERFIKEFGKNYL